MIHATKNTLKMKQLTGQSKKSRKLATKKQGNLITEGETFDVLIVVKCDGIPTKECSSTPMTKKRAVVLTAK